MTQLFASLQNGVTAVVTETGLRRLEAQSARAFELLAQASEREAWNQATMRTLLYWGSPNRLAVAVQSAVPGIPKPNLPIAVFDMKRCDTVKRLLNAARRAGTPVKRTVFSFDPMANAGSVTVDNDLLTDIFGREIVRQINDENQLQREAKKRQRTG
jgi:hypothetical protein